MMENVELADIVTHDVDLTLPAAERLVPIVNVERPAAAKLLAEARKGFKDVPSLVLDGFGQLYRGYDGPFCAELDVWAKAVDASFGELAIVNCSYELDHLEHRWSVAELIKKIVFGCTTGIREIEGQGMVHLRTLDWPIASMGSSTRLFRYRTKQHEFLAVGFPAFVGVLSGMVPGEYSATINWAPPSEMPDFHWGPSFLLRKTLEECRTYAQAVDKLSRLQLSTGVFYTVCGKNSGEACVIERTSGKHCLRPLNNGLEAQSNHYVSDRFEGDGRLWQSEYGSDPLLVSTRDRRQKMLKLLASVKSHAELPDLLDLISVSPLCNEETVQRMAFCPAKGELCLDVAIEASVEGVKWKRSTWRA